MRLISRLPFAVLLLGALAVPDRGVTADDQQQKRVITIEPSYHLPVGGIKGLWDHSDLVIRARLVHLAKGQLRRDRTVPDVAEPVTRYTMRVLEVFKPYRTVAAKQLLAVDMVAGDAEDDTHVYTVPRDSYVTLQPGDYVLFLTAMPAQDAFRLGFGPAATYLLAGGNASAQTPKGSRIDTDNLLAELRTYARTK